MAPHLKTFPLVALTQVSPSYSYENKNMSRRQPCHVAFPQDRVDTVNQPTDYGNKPSEASLTCEGLLSFVRQVSPVGFCLQGLQE